MKIVVISDWFGERMGYAENCLPRSLVAVGHEVHLVTSNAQPYFSTPGYKETYQPFIGPQLVDCGVKPLAGYTLHRLPVAMRRKRLRIRGLARKLIALRPDVVQTFDAHAITTYEATLLKPLCRYRLFHQCHMHASVFPPANRWGGFAERFNWLLYGATIGRGVSFFAEKCYAISDDAAKIAIEFYGMQEWKVEVCPLGRLGRHGSETVLNGYSWRAIAQRRIADYESVEKRLEDPRWSGETPVTHVLHVVGARPNYMKVAPVCGLLAGLARQTVVHTGQHYDVLMSDIFFRQLDLPDPDLNLEVGSGTHAVQTAQIMIRLEPV